MGEDCMKWIDVNCMIGEWTYKPLRFKEPQELLEEMRRLGISGSLVFHSDSWLCDIKTGNDSIINATRDYAGSLIPVIALTPLVKQEFGGEEELIGFMKKNRIGAVRLFPADHNYLLSLWNMEKLFAVLDGLHVPVLIEGRERGGSIDDYYSYLYELAGEFKNLDIVLLTIGYRHQRTFYNLLDRCPNIHIDTSTFITYRGIEDVVRYFGPERILFGSRMPFIDGGVSVGRVIYAEIDEAAKDKIAGGNLLRILDKNICLNTPEGGAQL